MKSVRGPIEIFDESSIDEICQFRAAVWSATDKLLPEASSRQQWRDPIDAKCRHWVFRDESDRLIAAARLSIHAELHQVHHAAEYRRYGLEVAGQVAAPDHVVVCPSCQGCGLGRRLLDVQDAAAVEAGAVCAVRQASPEMVRLLEQRNWIILGPSLRDERFKVPLNVAIKWYEIEVHQSSTSLRPVEIFS